jgi:hypothetical protein
MPARASCAISGRRNAEEKNEKGLRRSHFMLFFRQVICPMGHFANSLSSPFRKNISLRDLVETAF